jgi:hypothetical protein
MGTFCIIVGVIALMNGDLFLGFILIMLGVSVNDDDDNRKRRR